MIFLKLSRGKVKDMEFETPEGMQSVSRAEGERGGENGKGGATENRKVPSDGEEPKPSLKEKYRAALEEELKEIRRNKSGITEWVDPESGKKFYFSPDGEELDPE